jgi:type III pantothenate kinase
MKLLVDIGNTRTKWALANGTELISQGDTATCDVDGVGRIVDGLRAAPASAYVLNVAGSDSEAALRAALSERFAIELQRVPTSERCGAVSNGYRTTGQLGADRWAAIVAAWHRYHCPVCVIDAGTATTIDRVASDGQHLGGVIVPGIALMRSSLQRDTSDIDRFINQSDGLEADHHWHGRETKAAVEQGILLMLQATVNKAITDFLADHPDGQAILTGGDAELLAPLLDGPVSVHPALVLEGLNLLTEQPGERTDA